MKKIEEYMAMPYRMELIPDKDEGGFVVSFPDLPGCLTSGETPDAAIQNAVDAKREWLIAAIEDGVEIPDQCKNVGGKRRVHDRRRSSR